MKNASQEQLQIVSNAVKLSSKIKRYQEKFYIPVLEFTNVRIELYFILRSILPDIYYESNDQALIDIIVKEMKSLIMCDYERPELYV